MPVFSKQTSNYAKVTGLRCEYLINPIGIDSENPRFSWMIADARNGAKQEAYQVFVGTDSISISRGRGRNWQTNPINLPVQLITYQGNKLRAFTKYFWSVRIWDKEGKGTALAPVASFETGMMGTKNWRGSWISDIADINIKPAGYFRKEFEASKRIRSARAYIVAAGFYELSINGKKIGDHRLDPMYTRFDRRNLYVTYDVTTSLRKGENAVGVILGNGWYNFQSKCVWDFEKAPWRNRPAFCLNLRIIYDDGSATNITTDKTWKTSFGPIIYDSIYTGEQYDDRLEQPGWNTVNFDDAKWKTPYNRRVPSQNIVSQTMEPVRNIKKVPVQSIRKINDHTYIFDLGINISGVSQLTINGSSGTVVRVIHAERLGKDGFPDQSNIDFYLSAATRATDPFGTDIYILSGKGEEIFMPRFNYKGFQYVEVIANRPIKLTKGSLSGYFMHSDVRAVGTISTSSELINKIWDATNRSYLSNLFGYPTDCPQREKNGWTADGYIACETGLYNFDSITIYEKWLADHRDEQQPNGVLPAIVPTGGWGYEWGNGPDWTSTIAIIPWNIYLFYGDTKLLRDCYPNIRSYVDHINKLYPKGLTNWGLGDWIPVRSETPVELTSSVYYYVDAEILAKTARILGQTQDYAQYSSLAAKIKNAVNAKYLNARTGIYADGNQTAQSVPLYWGIVPDSLKKKVAGRLAHKVAANNYHLDVGVLGAKAILNALSENGQAQTAYWLAAQDTYPSWGWWIVNGATTLYENWNINAPRGTSMNHIIFGEIGAWLYSGIGGIKPDENAPGFKNILLTPNFVFGLDHFEATHNGPFGEIISSWRRTGNIIKYFVTVPANSSATLKFPHNNGKSIYYNGKKVAADSIYSLPSGSYSFEIK